MAEIREVDKYVPTKDATLMFQKPMLFQEISGITASILWYSFGKRTRYAGIVFKKLSNIQLLSQLKIEDPPTDFPVYGPPTPPEPKDLDMEDIVRTKETWPYLTIRDYRDAYLSKKITPTQVAARLIHLCNTDTIKSYNALVEIKPEEILKSAKLSTARYEKGTSLSVLDGVPFFVKEHIMIKNYKVFYGVYGEGVMSDRTAFCVKKLINAGALLIGTTSMTQFGTNSIGFNPSPKLSSPKNVWDNQRYAGGSSSGSGIVVALGLCPFAVGSDSLGSIRVPSGTSGIAGLKPTFSRISNSDCCEIWKEDPFQAIGPMASCSKDVAVVYFMMAGPDPSFSLGLGQPPLQPPHFAEFDLSKIRFGYYREYLSNSDPNQIRFFDEVLEKLKSIGSQVKDINIPELNESAVAASFEEISQLLKRMESFEKRGAKGEYTDINVKILESLASSITEDELLIAKKQRTRTMKIMENIFKEIDVFLLPTTSRFPEKMESYHHGRGFANSWVFNHHLHYSTLSSLSGIPSLAIRIGNDKETNLPIATQLMSKWWSEDLLLSVGYQIEKLFPPISTPNHHVKVLDRSE